MLLERDCCFKIALDNWSLKSVFFILLWFLTILDIVIIVIITRKMKLTIRFLIWQILFPFVFCFLQAIISMKDLYTIEYSGASRGPYWYTLLYRFTEYGRGTGRDVAAPQSRRRSVRQPSSNLFFYRAPDGLRYLARRCVNSNVKFIIRGFEVYASVWISLDLSRNYISRDYRDP